MVGSLNDRSRCGLQVAESQADDFIWVEMSAALAAHRDTWDAWKESNEVCRGRSMVVDSKYAVLLGVPPLAAPTWTCTYCSWKLSSKQALQKHHRRKHAEQKSPDEIARDLQAEMNALQENQQRKRVELASATSAISGFPCSHRGTSLLIGQLRTTRRLPV